MYGNTITLKANKPVNAQVVTPESQVARKIGLEKIGIKIDTEATQRPYEQLKKYYDIPAKQGVSESDRIVLGQIKSSAERRGIAKPQMITAEADTKPMRTQASAWGIEAVEAGGHPPVGTDLNYPRVNLADYPEDDAHPISRWFRDRPVFIKLGLIGANVAAQYLSQKALSEVFDHFKSALENAEKEFKETYPDLDTLKSRANLDRYKQAYDAALSKLNMPQNLRMMESFLIPFTRPSEIDRFKKSMDDQISKVASANDGSMSGYSKVAQEYLDHLATLYKLVASKLVLVDIAADIDKRGQVIKSAADALEYAFWKALPVVGSFPVAYYIWMDIYNVASALEQLAKQVIDFASEIKSRHQAYLSLLEQLDKELLRVSDDLSKNSP